MIKLQIDEISIATICKIGDGWICSWGSLKYIEHKQSGSESDLKKQNKFKTLKKALSKQYEKRNSTYRKYISYMSKWLIRQTNAFFFVKCTYDYKRLPTFTFILAHMKQSIFLLHLLLIQLVGSYRNWKGGERDRNGNQLSRSQSSPYTPIRLSSTFHWDLVFFFFGRNGIFFCTVFNIWH